MSSEEKRFIKWVVILIAAIVAAVIMAILVFVYCPTEAKRTECVSDIDLNIMPSATIPEIQVETTEI